jgi:multidrug efflux pump subunit AcrA (membrane-fusion protein)
MRTKILIGCLAAVTIGHAWAHGDEDHGAAQAALAPSADKPQRLPDGRVFVPKETQRRLEIRTVLAEEKSVPRTEELNGHVVMDPSTGGRVQSMQAGRIAATAKGLPVVGSPVKKGDILVYVEPALDSMERTNSQAEQGDIKAKLVLAEKQWARLKDLSGTVPQKEVDAAETEVAALRARSRALATGNGPEALRAPTSGIIASSSAINGQVVEAKEVLFEIIDPRHMLIEALAYDPNSIRGIRGAMLAGSATELVYLGGAASLRDGAIPLFFRFTGTEMPLVLGQSVKLIVSRQETLKGTPLPASAVVKNSANENIVWAHEQAEVFRPIAVQIAPIDGATVVAQGLKPGQRIVTGSATLINQIR